MKSAKWILVAIVSFACLSAAKNIRHNQTSISITKEQEVILSEMVINNSKCSDGMVEINGEYCPFVK